ncbi:hypothetical protein ED312_20575 [Sinomicrobium pectinilyticum]|uniref:Uncharacterized protein n=1 Tax=Sinomicrobium pectinilyticum TaxID=1084421 RepID=A0A3N0DQH9_SINP1|nr:hypothetical protein ED312_20575 [Sinomicrobium pectinilyticum]
MANSGHNAKIYFLPEPKLYLSPAKSLKHIPQKMCKNLTDRFHLRHLHRFRHSPETYYSYIIIRPQQYHYLEEL